MSVIPAEVACQQVLQRLFHSIDVRDYETVVAQFTADATWIRQGQTLTSHAAMLAALRARSATIQVLHILTSVWVEAEGADRAKARGYLTVYRRDSGKLAVLPLAMEMPDLILVTDAQFRHEGDKWLLTRLTNSPSYSAAVKPAA
mgnify:CR=1 FL=1